MINDILLKKLILSIAIFVGLYLFNKLIGYILYKILKNNTRYHNCKRMFNAIFVILFFVSIFLVWMDTMENMTTYMGLLSAGIAIAMKEIFTNIAGWIFIEMRKPFDVGHRIRIGKYKGDVIDKKIFQFLLMEVSEYEEGEQSTGKIIDIPNSMVFSNAIVNYSKGFEYIWNEVKVLLTFESDWKRAKKLLLDIINKNSSSITENVNKQIKHAAKSYMIYYKNLTPIVYVDVTDSGVQLTIRYLCQPKMRRVSVNSIWEEILDMISQNEDIALAYPTRRVIS